MQNGLQSRGMTEAGAGGFVTSPRIVFGSSPSRHCRERHARQATLEWTQVYWSELELEGELDGAWAADLVEGVEAPIGAAGA